MMEGKIMRRQDKKNAMYPHIIVDTNTDKPYYSIRYYSLDDNRWHIGYSSYNHKVVVGYLKQYFNITHNTDLPEDVFDLPLTDVAVVVLPFEVTDTVYYILEGYIEPCTVGIIYLGDYADRDGKSSNMAEIRFEREDCPYVSTEIYFSDIGKTIFLTREEAEKALKRSKQ